MCVCVAPAMELRLHNSRDPWRLRDATAPLRIGSEIPFSLEALEAMRLGTVPSGANGAERRGAQIFPSDVQPLSASRALWRSPSEQSQREREKLLARRYDSEEDQCDRAFKCGQWFLLLLTICFVAVVVTLLSMVFYQVGQVLHTVDGSSLHDKVDHVLDHAMEAALHTETATANAAEVSALARNAVQEAHPRLIDALNQSSEMFAELRDFSMHPQWTVSAGTVGRRRRD